MQSAHRAALLHRRVACELRICRLRAARGPAPASASSSTLNNGPTATSAAAAAAGTTTLPARPTGTESSAPAAEEASAACLQMIKQLDAELALAAEREAALDMAPPSAAGLLSPSPSPSPSLSLALNLGGRLAADAVREAAPARRARAAAPASR